MITAALFLAILIDPNDDDVLIVWDYVVGFVGVVASVVLAGALLVMRRAQLARAGLWRLASGSSAPPYRAARGRRKTRAPPRGGDRGGGVDRRVGHLLHCRPNQRRSARRKRWVAVADLDRVRVHLPVVVQVGAPLTPAKGGS
ncbi:MAG TPA: hypothetical protein VFL84_02875 [Gammaproteobacteria bacterium]|nr:hypothetical protein [Gammaproteobacteria bacterium]